MAFDLMAEVPKPYLFSSVSNVFSGIVQAEGLSGAKLRLENELALLGDNELLPHSLRLFHGDLARRVARMEELSEEYTDLEQSIPDLDELTLRMIERGIERGLEEESDPF